MKTDGVFDLRLACWCFVGEPCICGDEEKVLRHYAYSKMPIQPMTPAQRSWCVKEADESGEGAFSANELQALPDKELASAVLTAWNEYAKSQGF